MTNNSYRTTIQMDNALREKIASFQEPMGVKTLPDVLRKFVSERELFDKNGIHVGEEEKIRFHDLKTKLGVPSDANLMLFLLELYDSTNTIDKKLFESLASLK